MEKNYFLIEKILESARKIGFHPLISSLLIGIFVELIYIIVSIACFTKPSIFFILCVSWLTIGPYLIYISRDIWNNFRTKWEEICLEDSSSLNYYIENLFWGNKHFYIGLISVLIVSIYIILQYFKILPDLHHFTEFKYRWLFYLFYLIIWDILAYLGSIGLWGIICIIIFFYKARNKDVHLDPLHLDGCGGISFMGDFVVKGVLFYSTGSLMLPWVARIVTEGSQDILKQFIPFLGIAIFIFSILMGFFGPVFIIHNISLRKKQSIYQSFRNTIEILDSKIWENSETYYKLMVEKTRLDIIKQMRVWPWDFQIILQLISAIILPIIVAIIEIIF